MSASLKAPDPLDTSLPAIRKVQDYIREKHLVELKLLSGDVFVGKIIWQDPQGFMFKPNDTEEFLIWRHAVAYFKVSVPSS